MVFGVMTFFATGFKPWKEEKVKRTCEPRQQYIPPVKHRGSVGITMQDYVSNKLDRQIDRERYIYIYIFHANQNIQSAQSLISVGNARGPLQHIVFNQNWHCFLSCSTPQSLAFSYSSSPPGYKAGL